MNLKLRKLFPLLFCFFFLYFFSIAYSQTNEVQVDPTKKYDELIAAPSISPAPSLEPKIIVKSDELSLFLPKLDSNLYKSWTAFEEPKVWSAGSPLDFDAPSQELLSELGVEKILKQTYKNENHLVDVLIYKFMDFAPAYSAYTVLHSGVTTKLKVGKNASESERQINFWKGNYYIDINTKAENDNVAKEFIILASQEISNNIKIEQLPPVVAIQLPALNRVHGSERYCLGPVCAKMFFTQYISDFDPAQFNFPESGGIITAQYQPPDAPSDKEKEEKVCLVLARYLSKEASESVFNNLKNCFDKKKSENKDIDIDIDDDLVKVKNKKNNFTIFKQRGNLLAIAYNITNKKSGEEFLNLVPWPIEITKPTGSQVPNSMNTLPKPGNEDNVTDKL